MPDRWMPWLLSALVLAVSGCAGDRHATPDPPTRAQSPVGSASAVEVIRVQGHEARYVGRLDRRYEFTGPGVTMASPPSSRTAHISWDAAFDVCFTGPVHCMAVGDAVVTLASVTGPGNAGTTSFGDRHMLEQTLAYAVFWDVADCRALLSESRDGEDCRVVDLITAEQAGDLQAGAHVYSFVVAESASTPRNQD